MPVIQAYCLKVAGLNRLAPSTTLRAGSFDALRLLRTSSCTRLRGWRPCAGMTEDENGRLNLSDYDISSLFE